MKSFHEDQRRLGRTLGKTTQNVVVVVVNKQPPNTVDIDATISATFTTIQRLKNAFYIDIFVVVSSNGTAKSQQHQQQQVSIIS